MLTKLSYYPPYGSALPGLQYNYNDDGDTSKYKFGFNNKESDDETGFQDYGFRIYSSEICRFLSVDPLSYDYPMLTPYQLASNTPIWAIDIDGLEGVNYIHNSVLYWNGKVKFAKDDKDNKTNHKISSWTVGTMTCIVHKNITIKFDWTKAQTRMDIFFKYSLKQSLWALDMEGPLYSLTASTFIIKINEVVKPKDANEKYEANHLGNTFRHYLFQSLFTIKYGVDFAKDFGDLHEREGVESSSDKKYTKDNYIDLVNNQYARDYGQKFSYDVVAKDIESFTTYLNDLAVHLLKTVDGIKDEAKYDKIRSGEVKLFDSKNKNVKVLYLKLKNMPTK